MSTIVEELKTKITEAGGDASDVKTISEGIKKLDVGGEGGGGSAESAIFVAYVTGEWVEDESYDGGGYTAYSCDKTESEIRDAWASGKRVMFGSIYEDAETGEVMKQADHLVVDVYMSGGSNVYCAYFLTYEPGAYTLHYGLTKYVFSYDGSIENVDSIELPTEVPSPPEPDIFTFGINDNVLNATWEDISNAIQYGKLCMGVINKFDESWNFIGADQIMLSSIYIESDIYYVKLADDTLWSADSSNGALIKDTSNADA